ncbi:MAG: zinc-finger domain-containing protein [Rickettsiales bacterium]|nr:zinc-finger domain-containing protein [Rickettsiales bacterium]
MEFETIETNKKSVACDGGKGSLGHPRVWLTFAQGKNEVVCPYCSRKYVYKSK